MRTAPEIAIAAGALLLLAAAAAPRFRQASTASDVARVLDNFGVVRTALESYRIDHPAYPETMLGDAAYANGFIALDRLTTPVAYLPSIPVSPFAETMYSSVGARNTMLYVRKVAVGSTSAVDPNFRNDAAAYTGLSTLDPAFNAFVQASQWQLRSVGPDALDDRASSPPGFGILARVYDATNGTLSRGDIVWFSNARLSQLPPQGPGWVGY